MPQNNSPIRAFFAELLQRRVLQIGGTYIAGAWLCVEIFTFLFEQFLAPDWAFRLMAIVLVVGFPVSMVLAWIIQIDEDGHWEIDHSRGDTKNLVVAIAFGILVTAGLSWWFLPQREPPAVFEPMPNSLAVLPFADLAATPENPFDTDWLYHSLVTGLEQSSDLTLVKLAQRVQPKDPLFFGRELGISHLATGHIRQTAEGSDIDLHVLDPVTGKDALTHSYTWDATRLMENAVTIANNMLETMALLPMDEEQFTGTQNYEAYLAFLNGEIRSAQAATGHYLQAIDLDPGYTLAYIGLARSLYDMLGTPEMGDEERVALEQQAERAVDMARRLDPESADAMSLFALQLDNPQLRIQAWERALELNPNHAISLYRYAVELKRLGRLEEAESLLRRALRLRPDNVRFHTELATIYGLQGRQDEAEVELEKAVTLQPLR